MQLKLKKKEAALSMSGSAGGIKLILKDAKISIDKVVLAK